MGKGRGSVPSLAGVRVVGRLMRIKMQEVMGIVAAVVGEGVWRGVQRTAVVGALFRHVPFSASGWFP